jgi:tripartite ATP-independent transporter DctM subunit
MPGLIMALFYASYIIIRCMVQPSLAPSYKVTPTSLLEKVSGLTLHVLPLGFIVFSVTGFIFLGITTPSEAAASGALAAFILTAAYRKLNWELIKSSLANTLMISAMMFLIFGGAATFSQILAYTGATKGLIAWTLGFNLAPIALLIVIQVILFILGMFMEPLSIMMVTLPLFMPLVRAIGFDPVWFAVIMLLNMEMAGTTPPFGLMMFVMKGVAPPDTTIGDIYKAGLPFIACDWVALLLLIAFPSLALWLPSLMR